LLGRWQNPRLFQSEAQIQMKTGPEKFKFVVAPEVIENFGSLAPQNLTTSQFISSRVIAAMARAIEGLAILLIGAGIAALYPGFGSLALPQFYIPMIMAVAISYPAMMEVAGAYSIRSLLNPMSNISTALVRWTLVFAAVTVLVFVLKAADSYSRVWLGLWYLAGSAVLPTSRILFSTLLKRWNKNGQLNRHAVLVGGGAPAQHLYAALSGSEETDVTVVGVFDDRGSDRTSASQLHVPKLGDITQLIDFVRNARVDLLLVTLPLMAEERLLHILKRLWVLPVDIRLSAQNQQLRYRPRAYSYVGNVPFLDVFDKPLGDWDAILKAIEDRLIAALALVVLSPIMCMVALAVKLESRGPVFFKQKRYGFNNELIEVYKFRSMYHNLADASAEKLATKDDPRVTRVGKFIRRTSMDELPQLFNVLIGNLSLVGPRPHASRAKAAEQLYHDVVDGYFARHRVKPGITGWAQINGWRGETDTTEKIERRVEHDLYYIENWSLALDLYILAKTPIALLKAENAY
jgi:Undecaprenyl-phosphate glucose phosphotransferase